MQRYVRIDHAFAVMTSSGDGRQLPPVSEGVLLSQDFSPDPGCPINNVSWYDAVAYCNWLNEQEDITQVNGATCRMTRASMPRG